MPLPSGLQALYDKLKSFNGNAWNPTSNPGGFARGGNQQPANNFINSLYAMADYGKGIADLASQAADDADATAADRVQTGQDRAAASTSATNAGQSETRAQAWADAPENTEVVPGKFSGRHWAAKAAAWAAGVSLPAISAANALQFLQVKADGSGYQTAVVDISSATDMLRVARTANTAIAKADKGKWIDITSGAFTQTFASAATLGNGFKLILSNSGTGDITLDPNGSETIDGLASFIMYPGEVRLIQCDGTALRSIVLHSFRKTFTQSDNFMKPPGYTEFGGILRSGGAGGQWNSNTSQSAAGGSGGGAFPFSIPATSLSANTTVTIGSGGAAGTINGNVNQNGGDSTFANISVSGGGNGTAGTGRGGAVNGINPSSSARAVGFDPSAFNVGAGVALYGGGSVDNNGFNIQGSSVYGGGCGGFIQSTNNVIPPGTSTFGGSGGIASTSTGGTVLNGIVPSGGGGASRVSPAGAGARGQLDIWGIV